MEKCFNCDIIIKIVYEFEPIFKFCNNMDMSKKKCCKNCYKFLKAEEKKEKFINKQMAGEIDGNGTEIFFDNDDDDEKTFCFIKDTDDDINYSYDK